MQALALAYLRTPDLARFAATSREGRLAVIALFEATFVGMVGAAAPSTWSLSAQFKFVERLHARYEIDNLQYLITWATTDAGA